MTDVALIAKHIVADPQKSGRAHARVQPSQVSVWVLVAALERGETPEQVASDFDLLPEELQAAIAYYSRHTVLIDALLLLERDAWAAPVP